MQGMPISSVAPRGGPAWSTGGGPTADRSVTVSEESLCFSEPLTVLALAVLGCFKCIADFGLAFIVAFGSVVPDDPDDRSPFGGTGGGMVAVDFRDVVLLVAVAVDTVDATEERAEVVERDLFGVTGDNLLFSTGDGGARLPFALVLAVAVVAVVAVDILDAAEDTLTLGDDAAVRALEVETVETTLDLAAVVGVMSDLAVSKFVEPSLVVDMVEFGRERAEGGRRLEGPAPVLRTVDALEAVDLTDAADDRRRAGTSLVDAVADRCLRGVGVCLGVGPVTESRGVREELATEEPPLGVSLESGRGPPTLIVLRVAVDVRETVECVLRATDLTDAEDDLTVSPATRVTLRFAGGDLSEYMLWASSSAFALAPPRGLPVGVGEVPFGFNSSSCFTSISEECLVSRASDKDRKTTTDHVRSRSEPSPPTCRNHLPALRLPNVSASSGGCPFGSVRLGLGRVMLLTA